MEWNTIVTLDAMSQASKELSKQGRDAPFEGRTYLSIRETETNPRFWLVLWNIQHDMEELLEQLKET